MKEYSLGTMKIVIEDENALMRMAPLDARADVQEVTGILARIVVDDGCVLTAGLAFFPDGSHRIAGLELISGDERYARATKAGNLSVKKLTDGRLGIALQVLKYGESGRANLHGTNWEELNSLLGLEFQSYLKALGAMEFGKAGQLLGNTGKTLNVPAFTIANGSERAFLVAWAATRVVPLQKRFGQQEIVGVL